jgi:hypothetical protein
MPDIMVNRPLPILGYQAVEEQMSTIVESVMLRVHALLCRVFNGQPHV